MLEARHTYEVRPRKDHRGVDLISNQNACKKMNERISTMPFLLWHFSPGDKIENPEPKECLLAEGVSL